MGTNWCPNYPSLSLSLLVSPGSPIPFVTFHVLDQLGVVGAVESLPSFRVNRDDFLRVKSRCTMPFLLALHRPSLFSGKFWLSEQWIQGPFHYLHLCRGFPIDPHWLSDFSICCLHLLRIFEGLSALDAHASSRSFCFCLSRVVAHPYVRQCTHRIIVGSFP